MTLTQCKVLESRSMYGLLSFSLRICNLKSAFDMKCLIESFAFISGRKDGSGRKGGWMMCVWYIQDGGQRLWKERRPE